MRCSRLLFIAFVLFTEPAFAQARFPFIAQTVTDRVNIRAGQNNNFESVAVLSKGSQLEVLDKKFKWYKVALPDGAKAFVKTEHIRFLTPELGEVVPDRLNVRSLPNTDATTVGQLKRGQKFFVRENQGAWLWIRPVAGVYGWVHETLLVRMKDGALPKEGPDPDALAAVKESEAKAQEARKAAKTSLLKQLTDGTVECSGKLLKGAFGPAGYKVVRDDAVVCFVDGVPEALDGFVDSDVRVQGKLETVPDDAEAGVVSLLLVSLAF